MGKLVVFFFTSLSLLAYCVKLLPVDARISVFGAAVLVNFILLRHLPPRHILSLLFANYLVGLRFYKWGQLYPVLGVMAFLAYLTATRQHIPLRRGWRLFLLVWLGGVLLSALHGILFLGSDELTQFVGVQEYIGCAATFLLAYKTCCEQQAEDESLVALGWVGVLTAVFAVLAVADYRLASDLMPGVGRVVYGTQNTTPFGYIPKLTIGVEGVTLSALLAGGIGLSLLATRKVPRWVGVLMLLSGAITALLIYRRSIVGSFLLVIALVLFYYFGRAGKRRLVFIVPVLGSIIIGVFGYEFVGEHFGHRYWMTYGQAGLGEEIMVDRWYIWKEAWAHIEYSPLFGVGPRFFDEEEAFDTQVRPLNAHNFILAYLRMLGLPVGILCSTALIFLMFRSVYKPVLERQQDISVFALAVLGSFFGGLGLFGLFGDFQRLANAHMLVWSLAGMAAGLIRREQLYHKLSAGGVGRYLRPLRRNFPEI